IFFFYGILPEHEEVDWSLVYPELGGMHGEEEHGKEEEKKGSLTEQLDDLLEEAKIGPELMESLGTGLRSLSENTAKMSNIADASVATSDYITNVKSASKNIGDLSNNSSKAAQSLEGVADTDAGAATKDYVNKVKAVTENMNDLSNSTSRAADALEGITKGNDAAFTQQMQKMSQNVSALNAVYEMQVKNSTDQVNASGRLYES